MNGMVQAGARALMTLLIICAGAAVADEYEIPRYTVDGGAGVSTGGEYVLSGITGQPDAGEMSGGVYALAGGYWPAVGPADAELIPTASHWGLLVLGLLLLTGAKVYFRRRRDGVLMGNK